jgi:hypothetical protein
MIINNKINILVYMRQCDKPYPLDYKLKSLFNKKVERYPIAGRYPIIEKKKL